jgi:hypothetical protein
MDIGEVGWGDVDWIGLAQNRYMWRALVNPLMTSGFLKMLENYRVASQLLASRVVLSSIKLISYGRNISTKGPTSIVTLLEKFLNHCW